MPPLAYRRKSGPPTAHHPVRFPAGLGERLARGRQPSVRLTWVAGLAGCGKSTTVAAYVAGAGVPCAWLGLEPRDAAPAAFFGGLAQAISLAVPGCGEEVGALAASASAPPDATALAVGLCEDLAARTDGAGILVLDEVDHLAEAQALLDAIAALAENLPEAWQLVVIGREAPALPFSRWRLRRELVEVGPADLRLEDADMLALARDLAPSLPADEELLALVQPLAGWPAPLVLAVQAAEGSAVAQRLRDAVADGQPAADFLAYELYDRFSPEWRAFMRDAAIAEVVAPRALAAALDLPDATDWVRKLAARFLLAPVDPAAGTWAFPAPLRRFLRARAEEARSAAELQEVRRRLAEALAPLAPEAAVGLAIEAGAPAAAELALAVLAPAWLAGQEGDRLAAAIAAMPPGWLEHSAPLAFWAGEAARAAGELQRAGELLARAASQPDTPLGARAAVCLCAVDVARGVTGVGERLEAAAQRVALDDAETRGLVANLRGVLALERNDPEAARAAFAAASVSTPAGPVGAATRARALHNLGLVATRLGRFDEAIERYREAMACFAEAGRKPQPLTLANLAAVLIYQGRLAEAWHAAEEAMQLARLLGMSRDACYARLMLGGAALDDGDPVAAAAHFEAVREEALRADDRVSATKALVGLAEVHLREGAPARAEERLRRALDLTGWPAEDPRLGDLAVTLGSVEGALGRLDAARARLASLEASFEATQSRYRQVEVAYRRALLPGEPAAAWVHADNLASTYGFPALQQRMQRRRTGTPAPADLPVLVVRCFGPMEASLGSHVIRGSAWRGQLPRLLLAYLLAYPEGASKDSLVELLYPEKVPGRTAVHMTVSRVRAALEPALGVEAAARAIQFINGRYQLDPALTRRTDVAEFAEHKRRGDDTALPLAERRAAWEAALAACRGAFLADVDDMHEWVALQREKYRRLVQDVHAARIRSFMEAGEEVSALDAAEANLAFDRCSEAAHLAKIRSLMRIGRREAALRQARAMTQALERMLGVPPSPEAEALRRRLLAGQAVEPAELFGG